MLLTEILTSTYKISYLYIDGNQHLKCFACPETYI